MSFVVRPAKLDDLDRIYEISRQFTLLNLPSDKDAILKKIDKSKESFSGKLPVDKTLYFFVCEDLGEKKVVGCSQIIGQKGSRENPAYSFKITKKEMFSPELSMGFIHQVIKLHIEDDGPSEIGGLLLDKNYRSKGKNLGKLISFSRFSYIGSHIDQFRSTLLSDMAPPLTDDGKSEIWEALGRRFTGMTYKEADQLTQLNKDFIKNLFPSTEIYLCLLDPKARINIGQVGRQTKPALHMLKSIGFEYANEIDPFDGGPHLHCIRDKVKLIKNSLKLSIVCAEKSVSGTQQLISVGEGESFRCAVLNCERSNEEIFLTKEGISVLNAKENDLALVMEL